MESAPQTWNSVTPSAQAEAINYKMSALENCIHSAALLVDGEDSIMTDLMTMTNNLSSCLPDRPVDVPSARDDAGWNSETMPEQSPWTDLADTPPEVGFTAAEQIIEILQPIMSFRNLTPPIPSPERRSARTAFASVPLSPMRRHLSQSGWLADCCS